MGIISYEGITQEREKCSEEEILITKTKNLVFLIKFFKKNLELSLKGIGVVSPEALWWDHILAKPMETHVGPKLAIDIKTLNVSLGDNTQHGLFWDREHTEVSGPFDVDSEECREREPEGSQSMWKDREGEEKGSFCLLDLGTEMT